MDQADRPALRHSTHDRSLHPFQDAQRAKRNGAISRSNPPPLLVHQTVPCHDCNAIGPQASRRPAEAHPDATLGTNRPRRGHWNATRGASECDPA